MMCLGMLDTRGHAGNGPKRPRRTSRFHAASEALHVTLLDELDTI